MPNGEMRSVSGSLVVSMHISKDLTKVIIKIASEDGKKITNQQIVDAVATYLIVSDADSLNSPNNILN